MLARRRSIGNIHLVYAATRECDLSSLGWCRMMSLLVASLAMDAGMVGPDDAELRRQKHPLALRYAYRAPQRQAGAALALECAMGEGADVFGAEGGDCSKMHGELRIGTRGCGGMRAAQGMMRGRVGRVWAGGDAVPHCPCLSLQIRCTRACWRRPRVGCGSW